MRRLLLNESDAALSQKLVAVLNYDGLPITARHIAAQVRAHLGNDSNVTPIKRERSARISA